MRYVGLTAWMLFVSTGWSQDAAPRFGLTDDGSATPEQKAVQANDRTELPTTKVPNPFDARPFGGAMEGIGGMGMGMSGGMGEMDIEMGDAMGMMGMSAGPSPDQLFHRGLQRAIQSLKKAKTEGEKEVLGGYLRSAFEVRYDTQIANRKNDLERLKRSVARLESDLKRRAAAKDRVVQLQLQSVQLAAEGLLELGELQGVPTQSGAMGGGDSSGFGRGR